MGHNYAGDNRKLRLRRRHKEEQRREVLLGEASVALEKGTCIRCDKPMFRTHPVPYCPHHWCLWWVGKYQLKSETKKGKLYDFVMKSIVEALALQNEHQTNH